ncbi:MAG: amidohydrolase family protein [Actinomycetota bacterium]
MSGNVFHVVATPLPGGSAPRDLWIADGRITFSPVDRAEELVPAGGFVLPGLVDAHSHPSLDFSGRGLAVGSPALVAANLADHLRAGELLVREIGAVVGRWAVPEGTEMPRIQRAGRILAPAERYFDILDASTEPDEAVEVAIGQADTGLRWVKLIMDWPGANGLTLNYPPEVLAAVVEAVHSRGARVGIHAVSNGAVGAGVDAGVDSVEHGCMADEDQLRRMAASGIALVPTIAFLEGFAPMAVGTPMEGPAAEALRYSPTLMEAATRLGVTVLAGTDALPFGSVPSEIAALQRAGMDPEAALAAATTTARAFLGEPGLDEGAPADLVTYAVDPRNDPEVLRTPSAIVFGGRRIA